MGMYSWFEYDDIEVTNWEGLLHFLTEYEKVFPDYWLFNKDDKGNYTNKFLDKKDKMFLFDSWDEIKLISYWYDEDVRFLSLIACFLEGEVRWTFENQDEGGYVEFRDGECIINTGHMHWEQTSPKEMLEIEISRKNKEDQKKYDEFVRDIILPTKL